MTTPCNEAMLNGATRYNTGKPCKNGHYADRLISNRTCVTCATKLLTRTRAQRRREQRETAIKSPRSVAMLNGATRYFTDRPCKNGHYADRLVSNRKCLKCDYDAKKLQRICEAA